MLGLWQNRWNRRNFARENSSCRLVSTSHLGLTGVDSPVLFDAIAEEVLRLPCSFAIIKVFYGMVD